MSRIARTFRPGHKALIAYLTVGFPSLEMTYEAACVLSKAGCDLIELGIPFSDPVADGVTIQKASYQALQQGVTPRTCLEIAKMLRRKIALPLVFMSYYNPILSFGLDNFCRASVQAGVDGLIIPDLPPEEGIELEPVAQGLKLDLVYLLAPTSPENRISVVAEKARGFVYLVSVTGVTGTRQTLPADLEDFVRRVRSKTDKPLCIGFGISNPEQAKRAAKIADGVIVGSRLMNLMEGDDPFTSLGAFAISLRAALDGK